MALPPAYSLESYGMNYCVSRCIYKQETGWKQSCTLGFVWKLATRCQPVELKIQIFHQTGGTQLSTTSTIYTSEYCSGLSLDWSQSLSVWQQTPFLKIANTGTFTVTLCLLNWKAKSA